MIMAKKGIHRFGGTVEVPAAKSNAEAVNLGQVKDLVNRYNKEPARVATTSELTGTYATNVLTLTSGISTLDGVTLKLNDAVLVKDQTDKTQNGIYTVTKLGTQGTASSAAATTTSATITKVTVDKAVFEAKAKPTSDKSYVFTYSGTDTSWKDATPAVVTLADYGISIEGTATDKDTITIAYKAKVNGTGGQLKRRDDFEEGKTILNNTFVNVMEGTANADTRWTIISDGILTVGTSSITFVKDIDTSSGSINVVKGSITGDDTTTAFNIAHNLNLTDINAYLLIVKDANGNNIYADDTPTTSNEANSITLTFSTAPATGETYKVFIIGLE